MRRIERKCRSVLAASFSAALLSLQGSPPAHAGKLRLGDWASIQSQRYGFMIAYPGTVFTPRQGAPAEEGLVFISRDGGARLLVGAFENEGAATLEEYRAQLLSENYSGADLDYAPMKRKWFIVSGTRGAMHFYEKVSFTCGGKLINSWALLYPVSERNVYDRIVEAIAPTYTPGAGRTGACD
jgi:hypothetical protein